MRVVNNVKLLPMKAAVSAAMNAPNMMCPGQVSTRSTSIPLDSFTHVATDSQSKKDATQNSLFQQKKDYYTVLHAILSDMRDFIT